MENQPEFVFWGGVKIRRKGPCPPCGNASRAPPGRPRGASGAPLVRFFQVARWNWAPRKLARKSSSLDVQRRLRRSQPRSREGKVRPAHQGSGTCRNVSDAIKRGHEKGRPGPSRKEVTPAVTSQTLSPLATRREREGQTSTQGSGTSRNVSYAVNRGHENERPGPARKEVAPAVTSQTQSTAVTRRRGQARPSGKRSLQ